MVKPFHLPKPSQWEAIRAVADHVLVVAGAGTGKTHTVVGRILYLLGIEMHGERAAGTVQLSDIAAITFTNEAARDLKNALRHALRASGRREDAWQVDGARIGTIHSFCLDILRENALRAGTSPDPRMLEEGEALELATAVARDTMVEAIETKNVPGLDMLLGKWTTSDIDRWVVDLMRKPDRVRALDVELNENPPRPSTIPADLTPEPERALIRLARLANERLGEHLEREAAIDFDRIILRTRDLLRDNEDVRRALQRRIHTLIIDEFQDVDPAQMEIAYLLGGVDERQTNTTRLMLVGDPKQSIYRFRGADVSVWNEVARDFERGKGRLLPLVENFRSVPAILAMVEATAGRILADPIDGEAHRNFEVRFQPVEPERSAQPGEDPVEFLLIPAGGDGKTRSADEMRDLEAEAIARRIRELHRGGMPYQDIAILFAAWTNVERYEDALGRAGVPYYALRRDGFLDTREVFDLILALEVVRDPADVRALFGFLRSPFVGVRDETLLRLVVSGTRPYWKNLDRLEVAQGNGSDAGAESETSRLARAAELIDRYSDLRDRVPAAEWLLELLLETGYLAHLQLLGERGLQAIANVRQFIGMVRDMNEVSVGDLIRILRERRVRQDRVPEALLHGRDENVVTITSIHVAKGLEWRTVFWADLAAGRPIFSNKLVVTPRGIRLGEPDTAADKQPDDVWKEFRDDVLAEEHAERKRLWYVAATRARDHLILSGIPQGEGGWSNRESAAARLREFFPGLLTARDGDRIDFRGMVDGRERGELYSAVVRLISASEVAADSTENAEQPEPIGDPAQLELPRAAVATPVGPVRHSATEFLSFTRCPRRHWFKYVAGIREPELDTAQTDELVSAVQRGQIVHDVLERYEEEDELDELLEDAIGRWDENAPPPESERGRRYRDHLRVEVQSVVNHPEYREMATRPGARRELSFLYLDPQGAVGQGSIDLASPAEMRKAIELLDVKTTQCDARAAAEKAGHYAPQRDVYVTAAGAIAGLPVERFAFQFSRAGTQISSLITPGEEAAARTRFVATASAIGEGAAPLTEFAHECRFCGYRRVRLCPGALFSEKNMDQIFERLARDRFRSRFHLGKAEREYLQTRGFERVVEHARQFVVERLAPASPHNDGRQTPWRGHPVFIAQHATGCCCRKCLEDWHGISRGHVLTQSQIDHVLAAIERWLRAESGMDTPQQAKPIKDDQLGLL